MPSHSTSTPDGFTLIEVTLALGLFALAVGLGLGLAATDGAAGRFRSESGKLVSALRLARARAMHGVSGAAHGVRYGTGADCRAYPRCYVVFTGDEFSPAAPGNVEFEASAGIEAAWPDHDPVFSQISGTATATSITLKSGRRAAVIDINYEGRIDAR